MRPKKNTTFNYGHFPIGEIETNTTEIKNNKTILDIEDWVEYAQEQRKEFDKHETGYKESDGKLNYELDWSFIKGMAEKMALNKGKYEPYNWKRYVDIELLKQSLIRHVISVLEGDYVDDNRAIGHLESASLNLMMIAYQIKHHNQK
jgi:exopolysaccharide biosynthesis protein